MRNLRLDLWVSLSDTLPLSDRELAVSFSKLVHVLRGKEGSSQLQADRDVPLDGVTFL